MNEHNKSVLVIGGGPAGLMAAGTAAASGEHVILLEKNPSCGRKLLVTGSGRCNITNEAPLDKFIANYPENGKFLHPAFREMFTNELKEFFGTFGVNFTAENNGKVFPASGKASDVLEALLVYCNQGGVEIHCGESALSINFESGKYKTITNKGEIASDSVIICTGGLSYPGTGSTGDGLVLAAGLSHSISALRPGLVPLNISAPWCSELSGMSLHDIVVALWKSGHEDSDINMAKIRGDLLFTHFGVSGPAVLHISRYMISDPSDTGKYYLTTDLVPDIAYEQLDKKLILAIASNSNKLLRNLIAHEFEIPQGLAHIIVSLAADSIDLTAANVTRDIRRRICVLIKALRMDILSTRGYQEAMVTAGGVSTREVNPRTMESKIHPGLYFAGEVLDIDGFSGGYNLQAAFSTGYLAGRNSAFTMYGN